MTMTEEEFDSKYTYDETVKSEAFDNDSQLGMLETYGEDFIKAKHTDSNKIWSVVDSLDTDNIEIHSGMVSPSVYNIIYYVVTEEAKTTPEKEIYTIGVPEEEFDYIEAKIDNEGIGYYILDYTTSAEMPDEKSKELFDKASNALREFKNYINSKSS